MGAGAAALLSTRPLQGRQPPRHAWSAVPALPAAAQEIYCATWNGQIVVAGGLRSAADSSRRFTTLSQTALFDPGANAWTRGPHLPAPRHHIVLASGADATYGFGGFVGEALERGFQFRDDVYAFDGQRWTQVGTMPTPLGETVALSHDGRIHLLTASLHPRGKTSQGASSTHLVYAPEAGAWSEARPVPTPRSSATGAVLDGHLYVVGGRRTDGGVTNLGALERYDPASDDWTSLRPLPQPSGGLAGASLGGVLYVFGGEYFAGESGVYRHTWAYDPALDTWEEKTPMRTPRHGLAGTAINERIYAIGGNRAAGIGAATSAVVETLVPDAG